MKVKHLVILILFFLVILQILRKKKNQKRSIQLIKNNLYSELKKKNDKNKKKINELEELLRKEQRWSFYLTVFTVLSICGLGVYIYILIIKKKQNQMEKQTQDQQLSRLLTFPFNVNFNQIKYTYDINVLNDAKDLSNEISDDLNLDDNSKKLLTDQIRKWQLHFAKNFIYRRAFKT